MMLPGSRRVTALYGAPAEAAACSRRCCPPPTSAPAATDPPRRTRSLRRTFGRPLTATPRPWAGSRHGPTWRTGATTSAWTTSARSSLTSIVATARTGRGIGDAADQCDPWRVDPNRAVHRSHAGPTAAHLASRDVAGGQSRGVAGHDLRPVLVGDRPHHRPALALRRVRLGRPDLDSRRDHGCGDRLGLRASPVVPALRLVPDPRPIPALDLPAALARR